MSHKKINEKIKWKGLRSYKKINEKDKLERNYKRINEKDKLERNIEPCSDYINILRSKAMVIDPDSVAAVYFAGSGSMTNHR